MLWGPPTGPTGFGQAQAEIPRSAAQTRRVLK